jgi:hypothetical protein
MGNWRSMAIWTGVISAVMLFISFRGTEMTHFMSIARTARNHPRGNALNVQQLDLRMRGNDCNRSCEHTNVF